MNATRMGVLPKFIVMCIDKILIQEFGIKAIPEYKFHPSRKWRIDFACPDVKLAIEVEGGVYNYGRHNHPTGFLKDMEKYNMLTELGWHLLRYQPKKIDYDQISRAYTSLKYGFLG